MCYAILEVKLKNDNEKTLKRVETKVELEKQLIQLERMGTAEKIIVFLNHHTHRLTEAWVDEMYKEPEVLV